MPWLSRTLPRPGPHQPTGGSLSSLVIGCPRLFCPTPLINLPARPRARQTGVFLLLSVLPCCSLAPSPSTKFKWIFRSAHCRVGVNFRPFYLSLDTRPMSSRHQPLQEALIRTMKEPVVRPPSPYVDPTVKGPSRQLLLSQQPSSAAARMIPASVNKTALHPGGIVPQRDHTELGMATHLVPTSCLCCLG